MPAHVLYLLYCINAGTCALLALLYQCRYMCFSCFTNQSLCSQVAPLLSSSSLLSVPSLSQSDHLLHPLSSSHPVSTHPIPSALPPPLAGTCWYEDGRVYSGELRGGRRHGQGAAPCRAAVAFPSSSPSGAAFSPRSGGKGGGVEGQMNQTASRRKSDAKRPHRGTHKHKHSLISTHS